MKKEDTLKLLQEKITRILGYLLLIRLCLYIPIPGLDLDIFSQQQNLNNMFGFARNLTGTSFLGLGALGILPYINASIIIQLLTPVFPPLERLQKEEGELGRQQLTRYTRYLTFFWACSLSIGIAFFVIKPIVFNWSFQLALKIICSLTLGSVLSMWFAELISEESLGNGSSMIIFINIVGSIPTNFKNILQTLNNTFSLNDLVLVVGGLLIYLGVVLLIVIFQDAYKEINIVSARQLNISYSEQVQELPELKNSYIPIKLNQGGIMPLVFSSTIAALLFYPLQSFLSSKLGTIFPLVPKLVTIMSFGLNIALVIFFSCFYAVLILKPEEISKNLAKMAYNIPGIRQGKQTTYFFEQTISRLAFMGGLFLAFLAFLPIVLSNFLQFNVFTNVTSLLILIGVITDVTTKIRGYLITKKYEGFQNT